MNLIWHRDLGNLEWEPRLIQCSCVVRNELDGTRRYDEPPVFTENADGSKGVPYMPRKFPLGIWSIVAVLPKDDPYEAPYFISTDATQKVDEWTVEHGHYGVKVGRIVSDYGYGLHHSTSRTTLGCGRIIKTDELLMLIEALEKALAKGEIPKLTVI
jgi:hypothetical protein